MKKTMVLATGLITLATGVVAHAEQQKTDEKFCAAVASFEGNMAELRAVGPHSTIAEIRAATDRVANDASKMERAAHKMKTPTAKPFTDAVAQLKTDVRAIPDDATLQQVHEKIHTDVQNAKTTGEALAVEAGCPVAEQ